MIVCFTDSLKRSKVDAHILVGFAEHLAENEQISLNTQQPEPQRLHFGKVIIRYKKVDIGYVAYRIRY